MSHSLFFNAWNRPDFVALYSQEKIVTLSLKTGETSVSGMFSLIFALQFLSAELLVLEMPWKEFYHSLPDVVYRRRFAN